MPVCQSHCQALNNFNKLSASTTCEAYMLESCLTLVIWLTTSTSISRPSGCCLCRYAAPLYVDVTKTTISAATEDLGEPEQAETEEYSKIFIGEVTLCLLCTVWPILHMHAIELLEDCCSLASLMWLCCCRFPSCYAQTTAASMTNQKNNYPFWASAPMIRYRLLVPELGLDGKPCPGGEACCVMIVNCSISIAEVLCRAATLLSMAARKFSLPRSAWPTTMSMCSRRLRQPTPTLQSAGAAQLPLVASLLEDPHVLGKNFLDGHHAFVVLFSACSEWLHYLKQVPLSGESNRACSCLCADLCLRTAHGTQAPCLSRCSPGQAQKDPLVSAFAVPCRTSGLTFPSSLSSELWGLW